MKTSPKRSYSVLENERFGLVFAKTGSIISGTGLSPKSFHASLICLDSPFIIVTLLFQCSSQVYFRHSMINNFTYIFWTFLITFDLELCINYRLFSIFRAAAVEPRAAVVPSPNSCGSWWKLGKWWRGGVPCQCDSTGRHDGPALLLPCPAGLRSRGEKNALQVGQ